MVVVMEGKGEGEKWVRFRFIEFRNEITKKMMSFWVQSLNDII